MQEYIENENARLEREQQFWQREIVVKIEYKFCPNLTIIDTPGPVLNLTFGKTAHDSILHRTGLCEFLIHPTANSGFIAGIVWQSGILITTWSNRVENRLDLRCGHCRPDLRGTRPQEQYVAEQRQAGGEHGPLQDGAEGVHHPVPGRLQRLEQRHHEAAGHAGKAAHEVAGHQRGSCWLCYSMSLSCSVPVSLSTAKQRYSRYSALTNLIVDVLLVA